MMFAAPLQSALIIQPFAVLYSLVVVRLPDAFHPLGLLPNNDEIIAAAKKYIVEAIENNGMTLIAIEIDKTLMDHVHVFVSIPPRMSASQAVNVMKGYSSRHLRKQFDWLKKIHDKPKLWASSYYWGTTGNVSAQAVKRYIEECQG